MPPIKPPMPMPVGPEDDPMSQLNDLYGMGAAGATPGATPAPGDPSYDGDGLDSEAAGDIDPGMQHAALMSEMGAGAGGGEGDDFDPSMGGMGMNDMSPATDIGLEGLFADEPPMYGSPPIPQAPALPEEEMMGMPKGRMGGGGSGSGSIPPSKFLKSGYGAA